MELSTERLRVRPFTMEDVDDAMAYLSDPHVMRFIQEPFDRAAAGRFIREAGVLHGLVHAVEARASRQLIGHVIWHPWTSDDCWELGWILRRDHWHHGVASELTHALIEHARSDPRVRMVIGETAPGNEASIAALERAGLVRRPELDDDLPVRSIDLRT